MAHPGPAAIEVPVEVLKELAAEHMRKATILNRILFDAGVDIAPPLPRPEVEQPAGPVISLDDWKRYRGGAA